MIEIIGVRFNSAGKIYYFDPKGNKFKSGDKVVVETVRGVELGSVSLANTQVTEKQVVQLLKPIIRVASEDDLRKEEENKRKAKEAFHYAEQKIAEMNIAMKLIEAEYTFDSSKILFYFTADGRVDFRELVKTLAGHFKSRIELRQIGIRDESKIMGGYGICGRGLCCASFLDEFQPVSIKMAKEQGLSLNPTKISGVCGRLMCCLQYEQNSYEHLIKITPGVGSLVSTADGKGRVVDVNVLRGILKVLLDKDGDKEVKTYNLADVKVIKGVEIAKDSEEEKPGRGKK